MKKRSLFKTSVLAGAAVVLGAVNASAQEVLPQEGEPGPVIRTGVLVAKTDAEAIVRDCATNNLVVLNYGNPEANLYLVGESVGFIFREAAGMGTLVAHYPDQLPCAFYHS